MPNDFYLPVAGVSLHDLSDTYGADRSGGRSHKGIDIFAPEGRDVVAAKGGTVVRAGDSGGLGGLRVWVKDDEGMFHYYAHLSAVDVQEGQRVDAGARLGAVGKTGNAASTPAHLHYSVNPATTTSEKAAVNPYEYLASGGASPASSQPRRVERPGGPTMPEPQSGQPQTDPDAEFVQQRRSQSQVMAGIMQKISQAASQSGGRVLDARAMFGDVFADQEAS